MFEEWDGVWTGEKGYYWSWNYIHNIKKMNIRKAELERAVKEGKVRTEIIYNYKNPGKNPYFKGYHVQDVEWIIERKTVKVPTDELEAQLEAMDRMAERQAEAEGWV